LNVCSYVIIIPDCCAAGTPQKAYIRSHLANGIVSQLP
jgi:hypothetical protein